MVPAGVARAPASESATSRHAVQLKESLRGMGFQDQVAALAPPSAWGPVQRRAVQRVEDPHAVHQAASHGISGGGASVPHLDAIQRSFGHHDAGGIQAHTGAKAAEASQAMGAEAYATGNHVVFGSAPDVHTAAHEAAHVIQQKAGVSLAGGVGATGDAYERHADQVADAVVRGESAEGLLSQIAGGGAAVQRSVQLLAIGAEPKANDESAATPARKSSDKSAAPVGAQPGPHTYSVREGGAWLLEVSGRNSAFDQRFVVHGAAAALDSESAPPVGQPIQVDAKGPWSLAIEHRVRPEQAAWAKGKPVGQWLGSTHKALAEGKDFFDVGSEDFRDKDFDDLVVSGARSSVPEDDGGAYLVSSETSVEGAVARYDLIVGASASGRLDVVLDLAMIGPEGLRGRDAQMLTALVERLGIVRGMVQSSPEVTATRVSLLQQIAVWELAARAALIEARQAGAAAGSAKSEGTEAGKGRGR
jgi:hypothetical protein